MPSNKETKTPKKKKTTPETGTRSGRFYQPWRVRDVQRITVYMEIDVAKRLKHFCAEYNQSLSEVVEQSLLKTLPRK